MNKFRPMIDHSYLSPSGRVSKRAKKAADERVRSELFGFDGLRPAITLQPSKREALLREAVQLRALAAAGMKPRAYAEKAEELEAIAYSL